MTRRTFGALFLAVNALGYCMLSFHQTSTAAAPGGNLPFANAVEQRVETLDQLREIKELLKEQNALLRSGEVKVTVILPPKAVEPAAADAQSGQ